MLSGSEGETIRSAADVGWIRDLTVAQMMRSDVRTTPVETPIAAFREAFPLGSTNQAIAVDEDGRYAGMVIVADGSAAADTRLARVLTCDPSMGVLRHADAGYPEAEDCAREKKVLIPGITC